jgi:putative holliday junction resolvase
MERVKEWQPDALVIGVPFHPDGASHDNTARALKFARQLRAASGLQVYEVDERYSTTEALAQSEPSRSALRGRPWGGPAGAGARDADAGAACVILEQFLRSLR